MNKISNIISSVVIGIYESEILGIVYNITFDEKTKKCKYMCILNEETDIMHVVKFKDIYSIGQDCVYIKNLKVAELQSNLDKDIEYCKNPLNLKIYDIDGNHLGTSQDIEIDDNYQIINIISSNNTTIPVNQVINIGSVIIVGKKKFAISKFKPEANIKILNNHIENKVSILSNIVSKPIEQTKIITDSRFLIGRKITKEIRTFSGEIIAKCGSIINREILSKASAFGKIIEVSRYSINT